MYAIFEAKGKQFRAEQGRTIRMPSMDAQPGERVTFDQVLLGERDGQVLVGRPTLEGASVEAEVVRHGKADKIIVFKMKRRKNYRRKQGHRQPFTEIRIVDLDLGTGEPAPAPAAEEAPVEAEEPAEEKPAADAEAADEAVIPKEVDITGAAEELAREHGIDVTRIEGTGVDGRVLKADVAAAVEAAEETEPEAEQPEQPEPETAEAAEEEPVEEAPAEEAVIPEDVDITGAAEELAREHGIDVTRIEGTGVDGRVLKSDVAAVVKEREQDAE